MSSGNEIKGFRHIHPLQLSQHKKTVSCRGCTLNASGWIYTCKPCNYFLHIRCSQLPHETQHPCHQPNPTHSLSLLPNPRPKKRTCNACCLPFNGDGFTYVCEPCDFDIHLLCAAMPLDLTHKSHRLDHKLNLILRGPKDYASYYCNLCMNNIHLHQWRYRCQDDACDFDAHLACAIKDPRFYGKDYPFKIPPTKT